MKYKVDGWNNFCRVFELPSQMPDGFCFAGGIATTFQMVDWFNPVSGIPTAGCKKLNHDELIAELLPWLQKKTYLKPDRTYLVLCDFGMSFQFKKEQDGE